MKFDSREGDFLDMTDTPTDAAADPCDARGPTDLERQVAASEHTSCGAERGNDVRVAERHGIWTVTTAGAFVGDYHDPEAAIAAAAQARHRGQDGEEVSDVADPWQRFEEEATP